MKCPACGTPMTPGTSRAAIAGWLCYTCAGWNGRPQFWDAAWLARFKASQAGSRRALTMVEQQLLVTAPGVLAAIKGARTLMLKAEGRAE